MSGRKQGGVLTHFIPAADVDYFGGWTNDAWYGMACRSMAVGGQIGCLLFGGRPVRKRERFDVPDSRLKPQVDENY